MLNMTKVEPGIISDADMYLFFERNYEGGVCYISKRYGKANNKHLKSYDPTEESKHIMYLGTHNLYGYAVSKFLPRNRFKWVDP